MAKGKGRGKGKGKAPRAPRQQVAPPVEPQDAVAPVEGVEIADTTLVETEAVEEAPAAPAKKRGRLYVDFMGKRWWLLGVSGAILVVCLGSLFFRQLNLGIEFRGGTIVELPQKEGVTTEELRSALEQAGMVEPVVQPRFEGARANGWTVRSTMADTAKATQVVRDVSNGLKIPSSGGGVRVIGPSYGKLITQRAMLALVLSVAAILVYVSVRFEFKMSVTAVVALVHDAIITLGVYSLVGREVTPNTLAALLTILGYSLYDTVVVFHRIRENTQSLTKQRFMDMANDSINQVLARWVNTGLSSLIPVVVLLVFGGPTLKDFAFALTIGLLSGAYSSVAVASPLYAMWKETEPRYQALKKRFGAA